MKNSDTESLRVPKNARLSRRDFLKLSLRIVGTSAVITIGGLSYTRHIETNWIEIKNISMTLPKLSPAFDGFRMVQFSDIHMDGWMDGARLDRIVDLVNAQQGDLIVITGDFVTGVEGLRGYAHELVASLKGLSAPLGVAAILGNHDHWSDPDWVRQIVEDAGLRNVSNDVWGIERQSEMLQICGVDDYWESQDRLDLVQEKMSSEHAAVLLAHEPDYADVSAPTGLFDLQISGHSHGGQVIIPFVGPPIVPPYAEKYPVGLYRAGSMLQYTNRGVGMISPRVRFNCRPEITVYTLYSGIS